MSEALFRVGAPAVVSAVVDHAVQKKRRVSLNVEETTQSVAREHFKDLAHKFGSSSDSSSDGTASPGTDSSSSRSCVVRTSENEASPDLSCHSPKISPKPAVPNVSSLTGLELPDFSDFMSSIRPSASKPVPKTPARIVRMDAFRQNLETMLTIRQIVISSNVYTIGKRIDGGNFSDVYTLSGGRVVKFPNDLEHTTTAKIRANQASAKGQYDVLCGIKEKLAAIHIGVATTVFYQGVIIQAFSETVVPSWDETTKWEDLSQDDLRVLTTAREAFRFFMELGLPVDFRPSNLARDSQNPRLLIIRDFYELDDDDRFSELVSDLLKFWALGNQAIYDFLDPRPKS